MEYRDFIRQALPELGLRWRRFRRQSCRRRLANHLQQLGRQNLEDYQVLLASPEERRALAEIFTVTISRFWRNREVFSALEQRWLPELIANLGGERVLRVWSAGCACGEEPYSILILWLEKFWRSGCRLQILATDSDRRCLERARSGCYPASSFREMPRYLRDKYCRKLRGDFRVPSWFSSQVQWQRHDLLWEPLPRGFHLIFCRNLVYTYFSDHKQEILTAAFHHALEKGGLLIIGNKERLPPASKPLFSRVNHCIYRRRREEEVAGVSNRAII